MIGDSFPPEKRAKPIAFYSSALPIGAGIASLVAAAIMTWANSGETQYLPIFGELSAWRFTLIVVGLPGILLALLFFFFLKEPTRRVVSQAEDSDRSLGDTLKFLFASFGWKIVGILTVFFTTAVSFWLGYLGIATGWLYEISSRWLNFDPAVILLLVFLTAISLLFYVITDPKKRPVLIGDAVVSGRGFLDALYYLRDNFALFSGVILIVCSMTTIAYSQGLLPSTFERSWGWSATDYATINGIALLIIGPLNMMLFGTISDRMTSKGVKDASLRILYIGFFIMVPSAILPYFMPSGELAFAILCINTVGIGIVSAIGVTSLLSITPPQIRGQIIALYYLAISWFGSLGPIATGYLSSSVYGEENIRYAVATVPAIFAVLPFVLMPLTRKLYRAKVEQMDETDA